MPKGIFLESKLLKFIVIPISSFVIRKTVEIENFKESFRLRSSFSSSLLAETELMATLL